MVAPERSSRATMQIGSGRTLFGGWITKSASQISVKRLRLTSDLPARPADHEVVDGVDEVVAEGQLEGLLEGHVGPHRLLQLRQRRKVDVGAHPHVRLHA